MVVHRILPQKHKNNPLGFGHSAARWNPLGYPILYTCSHLSLCTTELMSIMGNQLKLRGWSHVIYKVDCKIIFHKKNELPADWNYRPHPISTQEIGRSWLLKKSSVAVAVPSARLPLSAYPAEFNLLLNPTHPDFGKIVSVQKIDDFDFALND